MLIKPNGKEMYILQRGHTGLDYPACSCTNDVIIHKKSPHTDTQTQELMAHIPVLVWIRWQGSFMLYISDMTCVDFVYVTRIHSI